jgi:hypothetical protein
MPLLVFLPLVPAFPIYHDDLTLKGLTFRLLFHPLFGLVSCIMGVTLPNCLVTMVNLIWSLAFGMEGALSPWRLTAQALLDLMGGFLHVLLSAPPLVSFSSLALMGVSHIMRMGSLRWCAVVSPMAHPAMGFLMFRHLLGRTMAFQVRWLLLWPMRTYVHPPPWTWPCHFPFLAMPFHHIWPP